MNFQNDRYTLRMAVPGDDPGIREVFAAQHFPGGITVQFLRGESPLASFAADGDEGRMMVIIDNEAHRTAAVGGAVVQTLFVGGVPKRCAYLTGLKIHPDYQKRIFFIARAYAFLHEHLRDCDAFYTTILDDNRSVIAMLEKKHRSMPEYRFLGHVTTYGFRDAKRCLDLAVDDADAFALLHDYYRGFTLTPAVPDYGGFGKGHFYSCREGGRIRAFCFAGDQRATKQYRMSGYGGIYRMLSHLPTAWLGYPAFPKPGATLDHGVISYLYVEDHDPVLCRQFLRSVAKETGHALLLWGCPDAHPLHDAAAALKAVHYGSRLYEVVWDGDAPVLTAPLHLETALL